MSTQPVVKLMEPTQEAQSWRDLSAKSAKQELYTRIALVLGLVLLAAVMAGAIYYCCNSTTSYPGYWGRTIVESNAIFSIFPATFGTIGLIGIIVGLCFTNFEDNRNGSVVDDIEKDAAKRYGAYQLVSKGSLEDIYNHYYKKNGGLGPLVRKGMLTPVQGQELRTILKDYHSHSTIKNQYEKRDAAFVEEIQKNPKYSSEYTSAVESIQALQAQLSILQTNISQNF